MLKRKIIMMILTILLLMIVTGTVIFFTNPLVRSEEKIKENLLGMTPIGTKMKDVITFVQDKKNWDITQISNEHGFTKQGTIPEKTIGEKSIRVSIGDYGIFLSTNVTVFWGFDHNSELVDVWVWKTTDGL